MQFFFQKIIPLKMLYFSIFEGLLKNIFRDFSNQRL